MAAQNTRETKAPPAADKPDHRVAVEIPISAPLPIEDTPPSYFRIQLDRPSARYLRRLLMHLHSHHALLRNGRTHVDSVTDAIRWLFEKHAEAAGEYEVDAEIQRRKNNARKAG